MTFPNNAWEHAESAPEICRNGNESTFRQNIGHSRFTYTSNHHKLHIYIKPPQASHIHFTYTSKPPQASHIHQTTTSFTYTLHIYIKPPQASHIHFTYTSNHHKLHIYIKPPQASPIHFTYTSKPPQASH